MTKTAPLRVLLACEWFVKYTAGLASGLAANGAEVTLLTRDHGLEFGGDAEEMRSFVASMAPTARHLTIGGRVRDPRAMRSIGHLRRSLHAWGPQVVHVQDSLPHDMRIAVAAGLPRPYALTVHDALPHPGGVQPGPRIRALRSLLRRRARLVFVHSEAIVPILAGVGVDPSRIVTVPHGVEDLEPLPLPAAPHVLFFGRITPYKGLDVLLEAMPKVWKRVPAAILTIAGDGEMPSCDALADPRVRVVEGHVPEASVRDLFAAAGCIVLPYLEASQSGVGALARRYGRPLVVSDVGGLPDLVRSGAGALVQPGEAEPLAAAITSVLGEAGVAERMREVGLKDSAAALWPAVGARTIEAYREHLL